MRTTRMIEEAIENYGKEAVINMYLKEGCTAQYIADLLGINKNSLLYYFNHNGILKHPKKDKAIESISLLGIFENRDVYSICKSNAKALSRLETGTNNMGKDCFDCVYRNRELSYCWYTMATDKFNRTDGCSCKHYISVKDNIDKIREKEKKIKERKEGERR